jgi:hypothetical protein
VIHQARRKAPSSASEGLLGLGAFGLQRMAYGNGSEASESHQAFHRWGRFKQLSQFFRVGLASVGAGE